MNFESPTILFKDAVANLGRVGPLSGRRLAFVGRLGSMNRREASALVREHGGVVANRIEQDVDLIVIGADHLQSDDGENDLLDDWVIEAGEQKKLDIIDETQLWQLLGLVDDDSQTSQLYTPAMLAQLLKVPISSIRRWHRRGLIVPTRQVKKLPYFDFEEVASARRLARLIASGASPTEIESKLSRLAKLAPDLERPLSQLSVIVDGRNVFFRQGEGLVEPSGQKRFDFEACDEAAAEALDEIIAIPGPPEKTLDQLKTPEEFIRMAVEMEDDNQLESAAEVYQAMALAFGPSADISFRLAELLYQLGDLSGARERYFFAVEMDPTFVEARASLGCILVELNQKERAVSAFRGALDHHPDYPDVHFHLAGLLDELGKPEEAKTSWNRFLELAPKSPWADEARERLAELKE